MSLPSKLQCRIMQSQNGQQLMLRRLDFQLAIPSRQCLNLEGGWQAGTEDECELVSGKCSFESSEEVQSYVMSY